MRILPTQPVRRRHDFTLTLINIVFLLLLFFLTTGNLTNRNEAQSSVPTTTTLPLERLPRPLLLVETDGTLYLDGLRVARAEAASAAEAALAATGRPGAPLSVLAQRDMPATLFLDIAQDLRAAGLALDIVTLKVPAGQDDAGP